MNIARSAFAADTVNGKIYAIAGTVDIAAKVGGILSGISTVEEYDPITDKWTFKLDKPTAGWGLHACTLGEKLYVTGGNIKWPDISPALEVYDPATDSWDTTKNPMPTAKYSHSTCVWNGKIYAFGGWNNSGNGPMYADVDEYDPEKDLWTEKPAMPLKLAVFGTAVLNNKVYIIGGTSTLHPFTSMNTVYELDIVSSIERSNSRIPKAFALYQNYPNPFNPTTTIEFSLPYSSMVTLKIYNILGEEVSTLVSEVLFTGKYEYRWNTSNLQSGVYLYRLEAEDFVDIKKMILMK
jgi:N-acetylneuraminic acid mutarotase